MQNSKKHQEVAKGGPGAWLSIIRRGRRGLLCPDVSVPGMAGDLLPALACICLAVYRCGEPGRQLGEDGVCRRTG